MNEGQGMQGRQQQQYGEGEAQQLSPMHEAAHRRGVFPELYAEAGQASLGLIINNPGTERVSTITTMESNQNRTAANNMAGALINQFQTMNEHLMQLVQGQQQGFGELRAAMSDFQDITKQQPTAAATAGYGSTSTNARSSPSCTIPTRSTSAEQLQSRTTAICGDVDHIAPNCPYAPQNQRQQFPNPQPNQTHPYIQRQQQNNHLALPAPPNNLIAQTEALEKERAKSRDLAEIVRRYEEQAQTANRKKDNGKGSSKSAGKRPMDMQKNESSCKFYATKEKEEKGKNEKVIKENEKEIKEKENMEKHRELEMEVLEEAREHIRLIEKEQKRWRREECGKVKKKRKNGWQKAEKMEEKCL